jgi:hypothetical protein
MTDEAPAPTEEAPQLVLLEVPRAGRRPRYHLGADMDGEQGGTVARPPQCSLPQTAGEVRTLRGEAAQAALAAIRRPETQLCKRCFTGGQVVIKAAPRDA